MVHSSLNLVVNWKKPQRTALKILEVIKSGYRVYYSSNLDVNIQQISVILLWDQWYVTTNKEYLIIDEVVFTSSQSV